MARPCIIKKEKIMQKTRIPNSAVPYLLLAPVFIFYALFWLAPVLTSIKEVFTATDGSFSLTANFALMGESDLFKEAVLNTAVFTIVSVVIEYLIALLLAVLLNIKFPGAKILTFVSMIPMAITPTAVAILWKTGLLSDGWINSMLTVLGFTDERIMFMNIEGIKAVLMVVLIDAWTVTPSVMIILLAGLQQIQRDQKEAAYLFGANKWQTFKDITLPALKPSITTSIITRMIAAIQVWSISVMVLGYSKVPFLVERVAFYTEVIPGVDTSTKLAYTYSFTTTIIVLAATIFYLKVSGRGKKSNG